LSGLLAIPQTGQGRHVAHDPLARRACRRTAEDERLAWLAVGEVCGSRSEHDDAVSFPDRHATSTQDKRLGRLLTIPKRSQDSLLLDQSADRRLEWKPARENDRLVRLLAIADRGPRPRQDVNVPRLPGAHWRSGHAHVDEWLLPPRPLVKWSPGG
jgi:hypothetical protein